VKNYLVLFAFVLICFSATAGDSDKKTKSDEATCTYSGKVLDAENAEALTGATVKLVEINQEVFADFDGEFTFENIPAGTYTLEISFVSYDTKVVEGFTIEEGTKAKRFLL
jgi:methionine-rich copper-binding protein CopC